MGAGNTTITGFANVTSTLQVGGQSTLGANVNITGSANVSTGINVGANVNLTTSTLTTGNSTVNTLISSSGIDTDGTLAVLGATTLSNTATVGGTLTLMSDVVLTVVSNTNIGNANTTGNFNAVEIYNFPIVTYKGAKITSRATTLAGTNTQIQEIIVAHDGTDAIMTVYGTVSSPASANLGVFSSTINTTHVAILFDQTSANTNMKMFVQLIK